jgi:uncharacterized protein (DUF697 family)
MGGRSATTGMGAVPFGINIGWFFAVSTGLIIYLGELYGYTYTKREAASLLKQFLQTSGWAWGAYVFGTKFMAEVLKGAGIITMGGATPVGMALDAILCGGITYAVGYTTLKYFEKNQELPAIEMRHEFRMRFAEGKERAQELARQRTAELATDARSRYATTTAQLKQSSERAQEIARERSTELATEVRSRYATAAAQLKSRWNAL